MDTTRHLLFCIADFPARVNFGRGVSMVTCGWGIRGFYGLLRLDRFDRERVYFPELIVDPDGMRLSRRLPVVVNPELSTAELSVFCLFDPAPEDHQFLISAITHAVQCGAALNPIENGERPQTH